MWLFSVDTDEILPAGTGCIAQTVDQFLNYDIPYSDDVAYESLDGEAVAMIEESPCIDGMWLNYLLHYMLKVYDHLWFPLSFILIFCFLFLLNFLFISLVMQVTLIVAVLILFS